MRLLFVRVPCFALFLSVPCSDLYFVSGSYLLRGGISCLFGAFPGSSQRKCLKIILEESSPREFCKRVLKERSEGELLKKRGLEDSS